jgi:agmatinase
VKLKNLLTRVESYFCPPGEGVYTVHTQKERRTGLQKLLYGDLENKNKLWKKSLTRIDSTSSLMMGICSDTGGGILRGANWGPLFIRNELYLEKRDWNILDIGDVRVIPHLLHDKYLNSETIKICRGALYEGDSEYPVSSLSIAEDFLTRLYELYPQKKVLTLGGDHSISYATTLPYLKSKKEKGTKVGVLHFDAHTDLLSERLGIDINFGSWAYHAQKIVDDKDRFIQVGIRSSGKEKAFWEGQFPLTQYWASEIASLGVEKLATKIIGQLEKAEVQELYISFDIDCLDAAFAGATGTPEEGGPSLSEMVELIDLILKKFPLTGADLVEVAPLIECSSGTQQTLDSAKTLASLFIKALTKVSR